MNRTQIILLIAVVGLSGFYIWSKKEKMETQEREYQQARYFPELEKAGVKSITLVSREPSFEYTLTRLAEDVWFIGPYLLDQEKTHQIVSSFIELSRDREMEKEPDQARIEEFGLDEPSYKISIVGKDGDDLGTILLGDRVPDYNHFYGRRSDGGPIYTVPAYTLGGLEDKPEDLREMSLFPVEVAAVERFEITTEEMEIVLVEEDEEKFRFEKPELGKADETKVKSFLFQLHDLKVGRFLNPDENPRVGETQVAYRAKMSYSDLEVVTELKQRVPANPMLVYGRRYRVSKGEKEPMEGTVERFVVEVARGGDVIAPTTALFEDRRVLILDLDDVEGLEVTGDGNRAGAEKDRYGKWQGKGEEEAPPKEALDGLLFTLKDLRFESELTDFKEPEKSLLQVEIERESGDDVVLRFGKGENGNPYLWRGSRGYSLSERSWKDLDDAASRLLKTAK